MIVKLYDSVPVVPSLIHHCWPWPVYVGSYAYTVATADVAAEAKLRVGGVEWSGVGLVGTQLATRRPASQPHPTDPHTHGLLGVNVMPFGAMLESPPPVAMGPLSATTVTRKPRLTVDTKLKYANVAAPPAGALSTAAVRK